MSPVTYLTTPIVEVRNDPPPRGSGMTREGYTKRSGAPTALMIRLQGEKRWRRLMIWQFSNMGTLFVRLGGKPHVVREEMIPREGGQSHATKKGAAGKMEKTMHEFKHGTLRSGSGGKVKSRKQAIAIGLSQVRRAGYDVPPKPSSHATMSLDTRVRTYLANMKHGQEIDSRGIARALGGGIDPLAADYALERAVKAGLASTLDGRWYGPPCSGCATHPEHPAHARKKSRAQLDREIAETLSGHGRGRHSHATTKQSTLFAVEIDKSEFGSRDLPTDARWRTDLIPLAEKELSRGRTYRRPKDARYAVIEWTGYRGAVGRLLDWLEGTSGITRYAEIFA